MHAHSALIALLFALIPACSRPGQESEMVQAASTQAARPDAIATYQVFETRDVSFAGAKRVSAKITIEPGLSRDVVRKTLLTAASTIQQQKDVDAVMVHAYRSDGGTHGPYNVGMATRAPNGKWEDADSNGPMRTTVFLEDAYFHREAPTLRFGLSEDERKKVYREIIAAEKRSDREATAKYPPAEFRKVIEMEQELNRKYKASIAKEYGLTTDQLSKIGIEGLQKKWSW